MERIEPTDPAGFAARKRLLFAIALSCFAHAWAVYPGLERATQTINSHILSPRTGALAVSLQSSVPISGAWLGKPPGPDLDLTVANALRAPDARYYKVEELDVLPVPRQPIRMPQAVRVSGSVRLLTRIDASGRVIDVSVFDSGAHAVQNAVMVEAMRRCAFYAARKNGRPVRSEVVIELPGNARV